jgi:hypothetical protein
MGTIPKTIRSADQTRAYLGVLASGLGHKALVDRVKAELAGNDAQVDESDSQGNDRHKTEPAAFLGLDPATAQAFLDEVTGNQDKALAHAAAGGDENAPAPKKA